jgi:ubiquitin C-terminal hydrolase
MVNLFSQEEAQKVVDRINMLKSNTLSLWGNMNSSQMLAHCNVFYLYVFEPESFDQPNLIKRIFLKNIRKKFVMSENPYPKNFRTAAEFIISDFRDFENEKLNLIDSILKAQRLGEAFFEQRENLSFGKLSSKEWNILFSKHIEHHLKQFNV